MIDSIIYDKETVVSPTECLYFNRRVLSIMTLQILTQCSAYGRSKDSGSYSCGSLVKLTKYRIIDIIIHNDNTVLGTAYEIAHKGISIEYLSVEDYSFSWWQRCPNKEIHSITQFFYLNIMFGKSMINPILHMHQPLIDTVTSK